MTKEIKKPRGYFDEMTRRENRNVPLREPVVVHFAGAAVPATKEPVEQNNVPTANTRLNETLVSRMMSGGLPVYGDNGELKMIVTEDNETHFGDFLAMTDARHFDRQFEPLTRLPVVTDEDKRPKNKTNNQDPQPK